jgi:glycolate oxidase FAD binding subunit
LGARGFLDWAGGLVWLAVPGEFDANVNQVMAVVKVLGGHASLIRASENVRQRIACRSPEEPAIAAISNRVRQAFDPKGILNPGRMG